MRYAVTALLVLGLGITAMAPVASAQMVNQYRNRVVNLKPGSKSGDCYMAGVITPCDQPVPLSLPNASGGSVAGGSTVNEPQYNPFYGGDSN